MNPFGFSVLRNMQALIRSKRREAQRQQTILALLDLEGNYRPVLHLPFSNLHLSFHCTTLESTEVVQLTRDYCTTSLQNQFFEINRVGNCFGSKTENMN